MTTGRKEKKTKESKEDNTLSPLEPHQIDFQAMLNAWEGKMIDITFDENTDIGDVVEF